MLDAKGVVEPWVEPRRGRGWLVLLLGVVVFAAFGAIVGYALFRGLPGIGGEPPLIRAEAGPYRHAPSDRGGLEVANANSSIVTVLRPDNEPPRVERILPPETAAPLEAPEPEADVAAADAEPLARLATPEPEPPPPPGVPYPRSKPTATELEPVSQTEAPAPQIAALPTPEPAAAPPPAPARLASPEAAAPPAPARPAPPAAEPARPAPAATAAPVAAAPAAGPQRLVRAEPAAPAAARPAAGREVYRLQLAAVRSDGGLTQAWADLRQRYPAALSDVNPQVERTDTTTGPLYRLQAGPFSSREAAANACGSIRASGGQCFIVGPIVP